MHRRGERWATWRNTFFVCHVVSRSIYFSSKLGTICKAVSSQVAVASDIEETLRVSRCALVLSCEHKVFGSSTGPAQHNARAMLALMSRNFHLFWLLGNHTTTANQWAKFELPASDRHSPGHVTLYEMVSEKLHLELVNNIYLRLYFSPHTQGAVHHWALCSTIIYCKNTLGTVYTSKRTFASLLMWYSHGTKKITLWEYFASVRQCERRLYTASLVLKILGSGSALCTRSQLWYKNNLYLKRILVCWLERRTTLFSYF